MSHQTGIQANSELKTYFSKCRDGQVRMLKVIIENEQLSLGGCMGKDNDWEKDFEAFVPSQIEADTPCYILFRLDTQISTGYEWVLISWVPDSAPVRQKMLYASTKATLRVEFGSSNISDELHCTVANEATLDGYRKHKKASSGPAPLTSREEELEEIKKSELNTHININTKQQTLGGVLFPIAPEIKEAVQKLNAGKINYIQMNLDIEKEEVLLSLAETINVSDLIGKIPKENARYHLFTFKHTHEGDTLKSIVFIYSMPGYNCTIKERMLYSSCKGPLIDSLCSWNIEIAKKLEIDDPSEVTEKYLYEELHPIRNLNQPKFSKPKGPSNRGPRRVIRPTE